MCDRERPVLLPHRQMSSNLSLATLSPFPSLPSLNMGGLFLAARSHFSSFQKRKFGPLTLYTKDI